MGFAGWKAAKTVARQCMMGKAVDFYVSFTSVKDVCLETLTISSNKDVDWSFCDVMAIIFQI